MAALGQTLAMAREKAQNGHFDEAHILYEEVIDTDRSNLAALSENGLLYLKHTAYEPAMMWLEMARAVEDSQSLAVAASECFLHLGLTTDVIEVLTPFIDSDPLCVPARVLRGLAFSQLEDTDDALLDAQVILQLEAQNSLAQSIKAICTCQLGLTKEAIGFWKEKPTQDGPAMEFAAFLFAQALYEASELEACISHIDELLSTKKDHIEALMLKSNALDELGRTAESDEVLEIVSRLTSDMEDPDA